MLLWKFYMYMRSLNQQLNHLITISTVPIRWPRGTLRLKNNKNRNRLEKNPFLCAGIKDLTPPLIRQLLRNVTIAAITFFNKNHYIKWKSRFATEFCGIFPAVRICYGARRDKNRDTANQTVQRLVTLVWLRRRRNWALYRFLFYIISIQVAVMFITMAAKREF